MEQYIARYFNEKKIADAWVLIREDFFSATMSTLYITLMSAFFATLNLIINLLRSAPFIILIVLLMPFTRIILTSAVGDGGVIVPLVIASFPFVARLVEGSLRELNPNIIEMAQSSGANTWQTVFHVMLPESVPSLITAFTTAITTILGYTAMSGAVGGGGLGNLAIAQGQQRSNHAVLLAALIILVILVQILQTFGTWLARKCDKRLKNQ